MVTLIPPDSHFKPLLGGMWGRVVKVDAHMTGRPRDCSAFMVDILDIPPSSADHRHMEGVSTEARDPPSTCDRALPIDCAVTVTQDFRTGQEGLLPSV